MIFTQYYLDCLSQASYLIGDEASGQAVIVDPRRDMAEYLQDAAAQGLTIVGVLNTHFHADFVSGHLELARESGAGAIRLEVAHENVRARAYDIVYNGCEIGGGSIRIHRADVQAELQSGALVEVMPQHVAQPLPVTLLQPHRQHRAQRVRVFIEWLLPVLWSGLQLQ